MFYDHFNPPKLRGTVILKLTDRAVEVQTWAVRVGSETGLETPVVPAPTRKVRVRSNTGLEVPVPAPTRTV